MSVCLFVCQFVCLSVCLSICLFVCLFVCLSVCLSACLSISLFGVTSPFSSSRLWQSLGYLIVYVTGRPDIQKQYLTSWLGLHEFPVGILSLSDSLSADSQGIKKAYLIKLMKEVEYPFVCLCLSVCLSPSKYVCMWRAQATRYDCGEGYTSSM